MPADYKHKNNIAPFAVYTETLINPVQNVYEDLLHLYNVRIGSMAICVEDTNETLQLRITIDGQPIEEDVIVANHSTNYYIVFQAYPINTPPGWRFNIGTAANVMDNEKSHIVDARDILFELRKTTNAGVGVLKGVAVCQQY